MTFETLSTMGRTQVQLWYNRLKEGREDVSDETVKKIRIREVADDIGI